MILCLYKSAAFFYSGSTSCCPGNTPPPKPKPPDPANINISCVIWAIYSSRIRVISA